MDINQAGSSPQQQFSSQKTPRHFLFITYLLVFFVLIAGLFLLYLIILEKRAEGVPQDISVPTVQTVELDILSSLIVDNSSDLAQSNAIAVRPDGKPIITYYDKTSTDLKVAEYVESGGNCGDSKWRCSFVDSGPAIIGLTSRVVVSSNNQAQIIYPIGARIRYAKEMPEGQGNGKCGNDPVSGMPITRWSCEDVYNVSGATFYISDMKFDPTGKPVASFYDNVAPRRMYYVRQTLSQTETTCPIVGNSVNTDWKCEKIVDQGSLSSIAFSPSGQLYIAFYRNQTDTIYLATFTGTGVENSCLDSGLNNWSCEIVRVHGATSRDFPLAMSLLTLPNGHLAMSYIEEPNNIHFLEYVGTGGSCENTKWSCELIDTVETGRKRQRISMAIDPVRGVPTVAYYNIDQSKVYIAQYVEQDGNCPGSNRWFCGSLASTSMFGGMLDMAISSSGVINVSMSDVNQTALRFASAKFVYSFSDDTTQSGVRSSSRRNVPNPPPPVSDLKGVVDEYGDIFLQWVDPFADNLHRVEILRNYHPIAENINGSAFAGVRVGQQNFVDTKIVAGNRYRYIVRVVNTMEEYANSEEVEVFVPFETSDSEEMLVEDIAESGSDSSDAVSSDLAQDLSQDAITDAPTDTSTDSTLDSEPVIENEKTEPIIDEQPVQETLVKPKPCQSILMTRNSLATIRIPETLQEQRDLGFVVNSQCIMVFDVLQSIFTPANTNLQVMQRPVNVFVKQGVGNATQEELNAREFGASSSGVLPKSFPLSIQSTIGKDGVFLYKWNDVNLLWEKVPNMTSAESNGIVKFLGQINALGVYTLGKE